MKVKWTPRDLHNNINNDLVLNLTRAFIKHTPVNPTAVDADKDPVGDRGPSRIVAPAVKTHFVGLGGAEPFENLRNVSF